MGALHRSSGSRTARQPWAHKLTKIPWAGGSGTGRLRPCQGIDKERALMESREKTHQRLRLIEGNTTRRQPHRSETKERMRQCAAGENETERTQQDSRKNRIMQNHIGTATVASSVTDHTKANTDLSALLLRMIQ
jgi:hypothetical protein